MITDEGEECFPYRLWQRRLQHECFTITSMTQLCNNFHSHILKEKKKSRMKPGHRRCPGEARSAESLTARRSNAPLFLITYPDIAHCMGACSAKGEWSLFSLSRRPGRRVRSHACMTFTFITERGPLRAHNLRGQQGVCCPLSHVAADLPRVQSGREPLLSPVATPSKGSWTFTG